VARQGEDPEECQTPRLRDEAHRLHRHAPSMWDWTGADPCVHCRGKGLTPDLAWNLTWSSVPRSDPRAGSVEQWPAHQSFGVCKAAIQGAAAHRRVRRRDQGRAVGDDSASRNRKFESTPLQRRVHCEPDFRVPSPAYTATNRRHPGLAATSCSVNPTRRTRAARLRCSGSIPRVSAAEECV
jgi:hypothetical protein